MELIIINKISKGCSFFASFKTAQSGVIKRFTKRVKWNIRFSYFQVVFLMAAKALILIVSISYAVNI